jgi:hypothetical protein
MSGGGFTRRLRRSLNHCFLGRGCCALRLKVPTHFLSHIVVKGARMRPLILDPNRGKEFDDRLAFDFQFARQIVDSNLTHAFV